MVKVIKGKVYDGINSYVQGATITSLSEEDEARLISQGFCEFAENESVDEETDADTNGNTDKDLVCDPDEDLNEEPEADSNTGENMKIEFNAEQYLQEGNEKKATKKSGK